MASYKTSISEKKNLLNTHRSEECGFFIACDDRSILNCVNAMLLSSGMVGLSDTEGKIHYLIDGRRGGNYVLNQVKEKVLPLRESPAMDAGVEEAFIMSAIDDVIDRYDLPITLTGTQIIRRLLFRLYRDPKLLKCASKCLYPLVQPEFQMSPSQVERNIRYSIKKSRKLKEETRVLVVMRRLLDCTLDEVVSKYGRP